MRTIMRVINKLRRFAPTLRSMFLKGEQIAKIWIFLFAKTARDDHERLVNTFELDP